MTTTLMTLTTEEVAGTTKQDYSTGNGSFWKLETDEEGIRETKRKSSNSSRHILHNHNNNVMRLSIFELLLNRAQL